MIGAFLTCTQTTWRGTHSAISSRESGGGAMRCNLPNGRKTDLYGQEAVPVRHSVSQDCREPSMTSGTCGLSSSGLSPSADLNLCLESRLKMQFGTDGSIEYTQTWKEKDTPAGLRYSAHTASAHRTKDNGCIGASQGVRVVQAWPKTPRASDGEGGAKVIQEGTSSHYKLRDYALLAAIPWATTTTNDAKNNAGPSQWTRLSHGKPRALALNCEATLTAWSTPQTMDSMECIRNVEELPKNAGCSNLRERVVQVILGSDTSSSTAKTERFGGYRLNPYFSAWLMGFPKEWTDAGLRAFRKLADSRLHGKKKADRCS